MLRSNVQKLVFGGLVASMAWSMTAPEADAFWHHRRWGSSGGSSGYYSSGGSSGGSSGYYSSGGSSGGSSGYYSSGGSSGGSSGYYSSGGSWGSSGGSSGGTVITNQPATVVPGATVTPETPSLDGNPPTPGTTDATVPMTMKSGRSALLSVRVPANAKVFVNGLATRSTGSDRRYVSNGLRPGMNYTYELRAQMERDGKVVEETKMVQVQAGQTAEVDFNNATGTVEERTATKPVKTSLILRVPADAKVFLSGNESTSTGTERQFVTTKLKPGQSWDSYVVRVEMERDGQKISKEETISLAAGESRELTINVDSAQLAQANSDAGRQ